jgi:hypothetical protein
VDLKVGGGGKGGEIMICFIIAACAFVLGMLLALAIIVYILRRDL